MLAWFAVFYMVSTRQEPGNLYIVYILMYTF